jgi:hypothetical protein
LTAPAGCREEPAASVMIGVSWALLKRGKEKVMTKYKLVCNLDFGDVLFQTLIWIVLVVVTFGLALPFFAYFFLRLLINKTELHQIT